MFTPSSYNHLLSLSGYRFALLASLLSWLAVTAMPVINAHGEHAGALAALCPMTGMKMVHADHEEAPESHSKPCPFSHFASFDFCLPCVSVVERQLFKLISFESYYLYSYIRYFDAIPRAPPTYN